MNLPLVFRQGEYLHVGRLQGISVFLLGVVLWLSGLGGSLRFVDTKKSLSDLLRL